MCVLFPVTGKEPNVAWHGKAPADSSAVEAGPVVVWGVGGWEEKRSRFQSLRHLAHHLVSVRQSGPFLQYTSAWKT